MSTSTAMFIGRTERGVMDKPTRVFNFTEFVANFGASTAKSELATSVRLFFANGGTQAYITRIASGDSPAKVTLKNIDEEEVLTLTARESGLSGGRIRVAVDYKTTDPDSTFNLSLFLVDPATLQESELEVHSNLSMGPGARNVLAVLNQDSKLVTASSALGVSTDDGYSIGGRVVTGTTAAALAPLLPPGSTLRLESNGVIEDVVINDGVISDELPGGYSFALLPVGVTHVMVKITKTDGPVRVLPSGATHDVATILQMGPALGGIEVSNYASRRPAPSGVFAGGVTNVEDIANLAQAAYNNFGITVAGTALTGFNLQNAGAQPFYKGTASTDDSWLNVQQKLNMLASQFNAKAQTVPNFYWRLEVQGMHLVFVPTAGAANQGSSATVTDTADLFDNANFVPPSANARYYTLGTGGLGTFQSGTPGVEGGPPGLNDYADAYEVIDREVDIFNLLILPRDVDIADSARKEFWGPASVFCQKRRAFLLVDPPLNWNSVAAVTGSSPSIYDLRTGLVKDHSAVYWSRLLAPDEFGLVKPVDPSGAIAGVLARIDSTRGVWKAPAGLEADIRGVSRVERMISDPEAGVLNPLALNTIRAFPDGIVVWGARTMAGFDNGDNDYKYIPVRRTALFLAESLQRGLKFAVFEPNDEPLWAQLRLAAGAFMNGLFRQGAFQGQKKSDAYFVKVDAETTTQNDINLGIVNVIVGFAPLKPAEFVVVKIQQIAGQIQT